MQLAHGALLLLILACVRGNIVDDDKSSGNPEPRISTRETYVMKIPASAKSDSRARGSVVPFKQVVSLLNPDDYSDENAGTPFSSTTEISRNFETTTTQISVTSLVDSWDITTSNEALTSQQQNGYLTVATTIPSPHSKPKSKSSTKIGSKTSVSARNNKRTNTKKSTKKPLGRQPLQQLMALKTWMNRHENETMTQFQSEESSADNLVHSLLQSSKTEQDENVTLN